MVPTQQRRGYFQIIEKNGAGVMGVFEQASRVRIVICGPLSNEDTGNISSNGIDHNHSLQFTASQHVIANTNLVGDDQFPYPLINAFVAATNKNQARALGP